jgi:hypothetical protein
MLQYINRFYLDNLNTNLTNTAYDIFNKEYFAQKKTAMYNMLLFYFNDIKNDKQYKNSNISISLD